MPAQFRLSQVGCDCNLTSSISTSKVHHGFFVVSVAVQIHQQTSVQGWLDACVTMRAAVVQTNASVTTPL